MRDPGRNCHRSAWPAPGRSGSTPPPGSGRNRFRRMWRQSRSHRPAGSRYHPTSPSSNRRNSSRHTRHQDRHRPSPERMCLPVPLEHTTRTGRCRRWRSRRRRHRTLSGIDLRRYMTRPIRRLPRRRNRHSTPPDHNPGHRCSWWGRSADSEPRHRCSRPTDNTRMYRSQHRHHRPSRHRSESRCN